MKMKMIKTKTTFLAYVNVSNDQARSQPDVCTEHKRCYLASNISAKSPISHTQDILNIRTVTWTCTSRQFHSNWQ